LIREGEGVAARVLHNLDVNLNKARQQVLQLLGTSESQGSQQSRGRSSTASTSTLDSLAKDLTASASEGKVDPVIGRDEEIDRVTKVVTRQRTNKTVLRGAPGVGKSCVVERHAIKIVSNEVVERISNKRVMTRGMRTVVASTKNRGEFEDGLKKGMVEI